MNIQQARQQLLLQLQPIYSGREAENIADWVIEHITTFSKTQCIIHKEAELNISQQHQLQLYTSKLMEHMPIQYVLGEVWFYGYPFYVNKHVLIPRPETEELVDWIIKTVQNTTHKPVSIMDIGTGSGCIAISLKGSIPAATVTAVDISDDALAVAQKNASKQKVNIDFLKADFLDSSIWQQLPTPQILVSNPPYIPYKEKEGMKENVKEYEPNDALFVPNSNPLIFYEAIANFALQHMHPDSLLFVEVHENYGKDICILWKKMGFGVVLKKDMQGKDRMIKASLL